MRRRTAALATALLVLLFGATAYAQQTHAERIVWTEQVGTAGFDSFEDVAADGSFVYVSGRIGAGALPGQTSSGGTDAFVRKYAPDHSIVWTRQFGTSGVDGLTVIQLRNGRLYVFGLTTGAFPGQAPVSGFSDIFLRVLDTDGNTVMTTQFGTSGFDRVMSAAADDSSLFILGYADGAFRGETNLGGYDLFVARLTLEGDIVWLHQFGTSQSDPSIFALSGIAVDSNQVVIGTSLGSPLPGQTGAGGLDGLLRAYSLDGQELWTQLVGTGCTDIVTDVALHDGNLIVAGMSNGDLEDPQSTLCTRLPEAERDYTQPARAFVQLRTPNGAPLWNRQYDGNGVNDGDAFSLPIALAVDHSGIYVASEAARNPGPQIRDAGCMQLQSGPEDLHVRAFDYAGDELWTQIIGSSGTESPGGVAVNATGVYVGGVTMCTLTDTPNAGSGDAVLLKIDNSPH